MKLKNVLIVVKDIERSKQFYHDLFGLELILDNDGNMILTEGLYEKRSILIALRSELQTVPYEYLRTLRRLRIRESVLPDRQMQSGAWQA